MARESRLSKETLARIETRTSELVAYATGSIRQGARDHTIPHKNDYTSIWLHCRQAALLEELIAYKDSA